ncbi:MAG: FHA domain-containing protein [Polyangiaceae bacterium]
MSGYPNKKSSRMYQCRDVLWETFEQMARELECSVDYLINEAMKQYARQRSYPAQQRTPYPAPVADMRRGDPRDPGSMPPSQPPPGQHGYSGPPPSMRNMPAAPLPPPPPRGGHGGHNYRQPAPLPPPPRGGGGMHGLPPPPSRNQGMPQQARSVPPPARSVPPPLPRGHGVGGMGSNGYSNPPGQLWIVYQGEKMPVTKDRFVIGRGKQSSDLTLKDPNVSRQHAMIEFQNGVYFMVDMGSTNGVEYNGQRIARKQIAEGDIFKICDHDLRFTYR